MQHEYYIHPDPTHYRQTLIPYPFRSATLTFFPAYRKTQRHALHMHVLLLSRGPSVKHSLMHVMFPLSFSIHRVYFFSLVKVTVTTLRTRQWSLHSIAVWNRWLNTISLGIQVFKPSVSIKRRSISHHFTLKRDTQSNVVTHLFSLLQIYHLSKQTCICNI